MDKKWLLTEGISRFRCNGRLRVWYGTVWYGMVWYSTVWYGMVWYGMVWYGLVWYGMVWYHTCILGVGR
jgi:hypothetical protein